MGTTGSPSRVVHRFTSLTSVLIKSNTSFLPLFSGRLTVADFLKKITKSQENLSVWIFFFEKNIYEDKFSQEIRNYKINAASKNFWKKISFSIENNNLILVTFQVLIESTDIWEEKICLAQSGIGLLAIVK